MLGDLAKLLLILGEDVLYRPSIYGLKLIESAELENRIILTRNTRIPSCKISVMVIQIPNTVIWDKLKFIKEKFQIKFKKNNVFTRCLLCNKELKKYNTEIVLTPQIPAQIPANFDLYICPKCNKLYWYGGHYSRTIDTLEKHNLLDL